MVDKNEITMENKLNEAVKEYAKIQNYFIVSDKEFNKVVRHFEAEAAWKASEQKPINEIELRDEFKIWAEETAHKNRKSALDNIFDWFLKNMGNNTETILQSDEEIVYYWKRKNCFGQFLEGLVKGSARMRDKIKSSAPPKQEVGNEWISVEDRLPEPHKTVLLYVPMFLNITTGKRLPNLQCFEKDCKGVMGIATHWMPLPKAPTQENLNNNGK